VTGGRSAGAKLFFTQFALAAERNWTVDVYRGTHCGHLEMFDLSAIDASQPTTT
jgi:hypothetical protein